MRVPFREKSALATVVALLTGHSEAKGIRPIEALVGRRPILSEQLLELAQVDERLLLLPDRSSHAQSSAASHPARGSRMEKAIVRPAPERKIDT